MQLVLFGPLPELAECVLERRDLVIVQTGEQLGLDPCGDLHRVAEQFLTGRRESRMQDAPVLRARFALHEPLAFERRDDLDDRLRAHPDFARQLGGRHFVPVA